jgi:hypothetical protein
MGLATGVTATGLAAGATDGAANRATWGDAEQPHIKPRRTREWPRPLRERRKYNMQPVPHAARVGDATKPDNEKVGFGKA